jgi:hypothetical protein
MKIFNVLKPSVVITDEDKFDRIRECEYKGTVLDINSVEKDIDEAVLSTIRKNALDTDPLYGIFTSGSTGDPKCVVVCHRSVIDFINVFTETFGITDKDVIGNQAPFDFDVSVKDIYSCIKTGATLIIIPKEYFMFPNNVCDMLDDNNVTTLIWAVSAIYLITGNKELSLRVIGDHILISGPQPARQTAIPETIPPKEADNYFIVKGILQDQQTNEPIKAGTIGVLATSIGSITNANGEFRLTLPDSLRRSTLYFSHLGYEPRKIEASLLAGQHTVITLDAKIIPIQEVVVRIVNPLRLLRDMKENIRKNYPQSPAYLTTFYREGIERKNKFVGLTEAVFKIYKSAYKPNPAPDQVKLLKMRRIISQQEKDTIIARMKSGINASLSLDLIKELPDFLLTDEKIESYMYASSDIAVIDDRLAHVIYFEQKGNINSALYRGELYIDTENNALLRAHFET